MTADELATLEAHAIHTHRQMTEHTRLAIGYGQARITAICQLRDAGYTLQRIAELLGITKQAVSLAVKRG